MKLVLISSASGGSAKTTTAVRLAEALHQARVPCGIIDLSPYPTSQHLLRQAHVPLIHGRSATTPIAAKCLLKPYAERLKVGIVDTGRLDDPAIDAWIGLVSALMLTTRGDRYSLNALEGIGRALSQRRNQNPAIEFLGFLPVLLAPTDSSKGLDPLRAAAGKFVLPTAIPADPFEWRQSHREMIDGMELHTNHVGSPSRDAYRALATLMTERLAVQPLPIDPATQVDKPKEVGLVSKLWKIAAKALGPKVSVEEYAR